MLTKLLVSCSDTSTFKQLTPEILQVDIEIPTHCLNNYISFTVSENKNQLYFYGYNYLYHRIDLFDIIKGSYIKSIDLEKEGPNGVGNVNDFTILPNGYIIIVNFKTLSVLDQNGFLIEKIDLLGTEIQFRDFDYQSEFFMFRERHDLYFNPESNNMVLPIGSLNPFTYDHSIFGFINLKDKSFRKTNIQFPDDYLKDFYGMYSYFNLSHNDGKYIYSFPISSDFYELKTDGTSIKVQGYDSKIITKPINPSDKSDKNKLIDHLYDAEYYGKTIYDQKTDSYFRILKTIDKNTNEVKRYIEQINEKGTNGRYQIPNNFSTNLFVNSGKVYLMELDKSEKLLSFTAYDFN